MFQNGKPVKSIWFGGERFDKYSKDDEDALAKYNKMKALIGTRVYVRTSDNMKDLTIDEFGPSIDSINPQKDGYVYVTEIKWGGGDRVDLAGWVDVYYHITNMGGPTVTDHNDLCVVGSADI